MKVGEYEVPDDLHYTPEHEWIRIINKSKAVMGITDYAAKMLHDVVYVELPAVGSTVKHMEACGSVESIKTVSDLYSALSGTVTRVNDELQTKPELVNQSPYGDGWLIEIEPSALAAERSKLLTAAKYAELISKPKAKKK